MLNLLMKIIVMPIVVLIASNLLTGVQFPYMVQIITTGVTLAVVGYLLEIAFLKQGRFWISNAIDFVSSAVILYILGYFFADAYVTFGGAILTAALITVIEFFVHIWLIQSGRARKEPSL